MVALFEEHFPDIEATAGIYPMVEDIWKSYEGDEDAEDVEDPHRHGWEFEASIVKPGDVAWKYELEWHYGGGESVKWDGEWKMGVGRVE